MSDSLTRFACRRHSVQASHVREFRQSVANPRVPLNLSVKQYVPRRSDLPRPGDLTIVAATGLGLIKELYEPLLEEILDYSHEFGFGIRSIWIADMVSHGESAALNHENLGNRAHWWDHSRDLLNMINMFQTEMPEPLVGLGHSIGAAQLVNLSAMHPRLFSSLILIEPAISDNTRFPKMVDHVRAAQMHEILKRPDLFTSLAAARDHVLRSKFHATWDSRCLARLIQYNFRTGSTEDSSTSPVVHSTTPKAGELGLTLLPNPANIGANGLECINLQDRFAVPEINPKAHFRFPLYRHEIEDCWQRLPSLRPHTLYILGSKSPVSPKEMCKARFMETGGGIGGSGGAKLGAVQQHWVPSAGHAAPFESVSEVALKTSEWLASTTRRWTTEEAQFREEWGKLPAEKKRSVDHLQAEFALKWRPWRQVQNKDVKSNRVGSKL